MQDKAMVKQLLVQVTARCSFQKQTHKEEFSWEERHEKCSCSEAISGYLEFMETFYRLGMYASC